MQKFQPKARRSSKFRIRTSSLLFYGYLAIIVIQLSLLGVEKENISGLGKRTSNDDNKGEIKKGYLENFDRHWPEMKEAICPNMNPNPNIWQTIFYRARVELDLPNSIGLQEGLFNDFFKFSPGGLGYIDEDDQQATIYLRIWKGANNAIRKNFKKTLAERTKKENTRMYEEFYQKQLYSNMNLLKNTNRASKACIVTALRDPVSHFISAYNEVESRNQKRPEQKRLPDPEDTPSLFTRHELGSPERFRQFVSDFLKGPKRLHWFKANAQLTHLYSMTGILYEQQRINNCFGSNLSLTAYLPSLSDLKNTFPKLLNDTCPGLPPEMAQPFKYEHIHASQKNDFGFGKAGKKVWAEGGDTARSLCALHVLDYACYDMIPVPDLCKEVYAKEDFRHQILTAAAGRDRIKKHKCKSSF